MVTGGAGYNVTVFDHYGNSKPEALNRVERIAGRTLARVQGDVRDGAALQAALRASGATAVIHFAGLKAVGESTQQPLRYYDTNVVGTLRLLEAMQACGVKRLVFSSSATVYGAPQRLPLSWTAAHTREQMCTDAWRWQSSNPQGYGDQGQCP